jgi:hypothetical protein
VKRAPTLWTKFDDVLSKRLWLVHREDTVRFRLPKQSDVLLDFCEIFLVKLQRSDASCILLGFVTV